MLGEDLAKGRHKVRRVLPHWLANPDIVSVDLSDQQVAIADMEGLDPVILKNLASNGVTHFFPVQRQLIPYMLANKVLVVKIIVTDDLFKAECYSFRRTPCSGHTTCVSRPRPEVEKLWLLSCQSSRLSKAGLCPKSEL